MLSYVMFGTNNAEEARRFYEPVLGAIGYKVFHDHGSLGLAPDGDPSQGHTVWVGRPHDGQAARPSNGTMPGFHARTRSEVRAFHAAALANGGTCEGPPGLREAYGPNMYMAYVRDPVGNKMSALCMAEIDD